MYESGRLWAVKKQNANKFQTGSFSYVAPKIYVRQGDADRVAKKANKHYERWLDQTSDPEKVRADATRIAQYRDSGTVEEYIEQHIQQVNDARTREIAEGPWIVAEVTIEVKQTL